MPLYSGGLWLAVIITPAAACRCGTLKVTTGVGTGPWSQKTTRTPCATSTRATACANCSAIKRRSCPTTTPRSAAPSVCFTQSAIAAAQRRTLAIVKSSAITARHPSVPKRIKYLPPVPLRHSAWKGELFSELLPILTVRYRYKPLDKFPLPPGKGDRGLGSRLMQQACPHLVLAARQAQLRQDADGD